MSSFIVPMSNLPSISSLAKPGQNVQASSGEDIPFSDFLQKAVGDLNQTGESARSTMYGLALGDTDDLHTGAIAAVKSSTSINFTSSLVSTAIRSYNELMRMQI
ncbi:flagellar hook-basal body complex protein FliE [Ruminococcaceae bacterium OttesenSCG-928-I18]|nr:flagellar hook-basal body complex protein FliE [Ruminococcaceae bacterium OttesenSCG-928-I18]